MSADVASTLSSGAAKVGRYFTVVSLLPATVLVVYVYGLVQIGGSDRVRWSALADINLAEVLLASFGAVVIALALNPLQFALIQVMEGYWGTSRLAVELATARTMYHRRRKSNLEDGDQLPAQWLGKDTTLALRSESAPPELVRAAIVAAESRRALASYPQYLDEVMPTRLGNVLRRYERLVGRAYELDPITAVPRLAMVGGEREIGYVQNQRVQLELAIRTTFVALLAALTTVLVMWRHGLWLLLALVPYTVAFLAYRGAVAVAHEYGTSVAVLTELSRFDLYARLHLPHPNTTADERITNATLRKVFDHRQETLAYQKPPPVEVPQQQPQTSVTPE